MWSSFISLEAAFSFNDERFKYYLELISAKYMFIV